MCDWCNNENDKPLSEWFDPLLSKHAKAYNEFMCKGRWPENFLYEMIAKRVVVDEGWQEIVNNKILDALEDHCSTGGKTLSHDETIPKNVDEIVTRIKGNTAPESPEIGLVIPDLETEADADLWETVGDKAQKLVNRSSALIDDIMSLLAEIDPANDPNEPGHEELNQAILRLTECEMWVDRFVRYCYERSETY